MYTRPFLMVVAQFANIAHKNDKRKFSGEPYIIHPFEVASIVSGVTDDAFMIAAAYLHDVVEDTNITLQEIEENFGVQVAQYVSELTNPANSSVYSRQENHEINLAHIAKASANGKTIKLADIISNATGLVEIAPEFASVWINEKFDYLVHLEDGHPGLFEMALNTLNAAKEDLRILSKLYEMPGRKLSP